jgi:hypothetical protein
MVFYEINLLVYPVLGLFVWSTSKNTYMVYILSLQTAFSLPLLFLLQLLVLMDVKQLVEFFVTITYFQ